MDFSADQADGSSSDGEEEADEDEKLAPQKNLNKIEENVVHFTENSKSKSDFVNVDVVLPKTFTCVLCSFLGTSKKQVSEHIKDFHKIEMNEHLLDQTYSTMRLESMITDTPDKKSAETIALPVRVQNPRIVGALRSSRTRIFLFMNIIDFSRMPKNQQTRQKRSSRTIFSPIIKKNDHLKKSTDFEPCF